MNVTTFKNIALKTALLQDLIIKVKKKHLNNSGAKKKIAIFKQYAKPAMNLKL